MNQLQHCKFVQAISPAAILDNASATATEVDASDFSYATFVINLGATDIALTALKLQSASASGGSFADVTGADFDGNNDIDGNACVLPVATDDDQVYVIQVDLRGQESFFKLVATFGDGTAGGYIAATCILSRAQGPLLAASDYCDGHIIRV